MKIIIAFLLLLFCFFCAPVVHIQIVDDYDRQKYLKACVIGQYEEINNILQEELRQKNFMIIDNKTLMSTFIELGYNVLEEIFLTEDIRKKINEKFEVDALFIYEIGDLKIEHYPIFPLFPLGVSGKTSTQGTHVFASISIKMMDAKDGRILWTASGSYSSKRGFIFTSDYEVALKKIIDHIFKRSPSL
ncbi:MAG: hypothetical protein AB1410_05515 [Acidobacteriota bacterium]